MKSVFFHRSFFLKNSIQFALHCIITVFEYHNNILIFRKTFRVYSCVPGINIATYIGIKRFVYATLKNAEQCITSSLAQYLF